MCSVAVLKLQHRLKCFIYNGTGVYKEGYRVDHSQRTVQPKYFLFFSKGNCQRKLIQTCLKANQD